MTEGLMRQNGEGAIVKGKNWALAADVGLPRPELRVPKVFQWESPSAGCALTINAKVGNFARTESRPCSDMQHCAYCPFRNIVPLASYIPAYHLLGHHLVHYINFLAFFHSTPQTL